MRKITLTLMIALSTTLFTNEATAQNRPLACQVEAAAGLLWENGRWVTKTLIEGKFILVQSGNTLTKDSIAKAFNLGAEVTCRNNTNYIECTNEYGEALFFNPKTLKGGTAYLFGSINEGNVRDSVFVRAFSCTPF